MCESDNERALKRAMCEPRHSDRDTSTEVRCDSANVVGADCLIDVSVPSLEEASVRLS